jgi:hypothetical protein
VAIDASAAPMSVHDDDHANRHAPFLACTRACVRLQVRLLRQLLQDQPSACFAYADAVSQLQPCCPATMLPGSAHVAVFKVTNSSGAQQTLMSVCLPLPVDGVVLSDSGGRQRGVTSVPPVPKVGSQEGGRGRGEVAARLALLLLSRALSSAHKRTHGHAHAPPVCLRARRRSRPDRPGQ